MAAVNHTRGVKLVLKVGDGADPEVFTALCTINAERGITFNKDMGEETIPDCTDPDLIGWVAREGRSKSISFDGGGMLNKQDVADFWAWWDGDDSKNCKVILDDDLPANVITFSGAFKMPSFAINGDRGSKATATMSIASDGAVTATFGANVS